MAASSCSSDDASTPVQINAEASLRDAPPQSDAVIGSCVPGDVSSFTGGAYEPPVGAYQGKCDSAEIEAYISCRQNNDAVACNSLTSGGGATCLACIETKETAANWGPIVYVSSTDAFVNTAGCLALAFGEGQSTTGCGATLQKSYNCEQAACEANCANAPSVDIIDCENASVVANGGCTSFANAEKLACVEDGGGEGAQCYRGTGEDQFVYIARVAAYFCGFDAIGDAGDEG